MRLVRFRNRRDAGRYLADALRAHARRADVLVLGLPRGGVPVAYEVAIALDAPLDVFVVRKLGVPGNEEVAIGAVASGGVRVLNQDVIDLLRIPAEIVDAISDAERREVASRERLYRGQFATGAVADRTLILVDDGLATGSTMAAAVEGLRLQRPRRIVVAVPVASSEALVLMRRLADDAVCLRTPEPFYGVGMWYEDFEQVRDEEVRRLLTAAQRPLHSMVPV